MNCDPRIALSIVNPEVVRINEDLDLDFINSMTKKDLGMDQYPYHQPVDERVVIFMRPEATTQMGVMEGLARWRDGSSPGSSLSQEDC